MSQKEYVTQYTDIIYSTKEEMQKGLKLNAIDPYWLDVMAYRDSNKSYLKLSSVARKPLTFTNTLGVRSALDGFMKKCQSFISNMKSIIVPEQLKIATKSAFMAVLKGVADFSNIKISDNSLNAILVGTYREDNPEHKILLRYHSAINRYLSGQETNLTTETAKFVYKDLLGLEGIINYRQRDYSNSAQLAQTRGDIVYPFAPYSRILQMMNDLNLLYKNSESSPLAKALAIIFYIDLVKPFDYCNDAVGCLLAKIVLSETQLGSDAFLLPLEQCITGAGDFGKIFNLVQTSGDMTYFYRYAVGIISPLLDSKIEEFQQLNLSGTLREENKSLSQKEIAIIEKEKFEQLNIFDSDVSEPIHEEPTNKERQETECKTQDKADDKAKDGDVDSIINEQDSCKEEIESIDAIEQIESKELSIRPQENVLSAKDIKEYVKYLLEIDPSLNKNQATFLANHCQIGRYYTIQQFKKFTRCAYETARTSMDKLAELKYYKKLKIKNKYVYTPIKQGEQQ